MWLWRRMKRKSWIEHKTNEEVLDEVNKKEQNIILNIIMKIKMKLIRHLLRNNEFFTNIMEEKIDGKINRGRSRKCFFEKILHWIDFTSQEDG